MKVNFYDGGFCYHPEAIAIKGGKKSPVKFPAICTLIIHPQYGPILYDTGYSEHFFNATKKFPYNIYARITPVTVEKSDKVSEKIKKVGYEPKDIKNIILSHFHADHIGALKEFPKANYIYTQDSYDILKNKKGFGALIKGFLPDLIPQNFERQSIVINQEKRIYKHFLCSYFNKVYDLFGDQSIIGVEIPGHAKGQLGIYLETSDKNYFLIADACYLSETYEKLKFPSEIVHLINDNKREYIDTIERIHKLYKERPDICIVPSHCGQKFKELVKDIRWDISDLNVCHH